ncbi:MAG: FecR domain-containing protein, partial [Opitutaceae bacterium]
MKNLPNRSGDDAIDTAAATWLCERDEGFASGRAAAFAAWCAADLRHAAAVARTAEALALMGELSAMRARLEEKLAAEPTAPPVANEIFRPWWHRPAAQWGGLAAAVALGGTLWFLTHGRAPTVEYFTATATAPREVALRDGSIMNVNRESDVAVQLTAGERRVTLARGEAHFAVAHDTSRPFIVTAAGVSVRAVGTAFSVRLGEAGVEVLVTEGKVQVARVDPNALAPDTAAGDPARWGKRAPPQPTLLSANERTMVARASSAPLRIEPAAPAAIREALAWHGRTSTFSDVPLREIVAGSTAATSRSSRSPTTNSARASSGAPSRSTRPRRLAGSSRRTATSRSSCAAKTKSSCTARGERVRPVIAFREFVFGRPARWRTPKPRPRAGCLHEPFRAWTTSFIRALTHFIGRCVKGVALFLRMLSRLAPTPHVFAGTLCCALSLTSVVSAAEQRRSYNLPKGDAATTLNQFAGASGRQIVFMMEKVRGEQTNAIAGEFAPREALERMLAGTTLVVSQDAATGAFVVSRKRPDAPPAAKGEADSAQSKKPSTTMKKSLPLRLTAAFAAFATVLAAQTPGAVADSAPKEEAVILSAFSVHSTKDLGYRATNTMTASRIGMEIMRLPLNVNVITEEFLTDIGVHQFTDAFRYTSNIVVSSGEPDLTGQAGVTIRGFQAPFILRNGFRRNSNLLPVNID